MYEQIAYNYPWTAAEIERAMPPGLDAREMRLILDMVIPVCEPGTSLEDCLIDVAAMTEQNSVNQMIRDILACMT